MVFLIIIDLSVLHSQITFQSPSVQVGTVSFRNSVLQKQRYVRDSGRQQAVQFGRFLSQNSRFANKNLNSDSHVPSYHDCLPADTALWISAEMEKSCPHLKGTLSQWTISGFWACRIWGEEHTGLITQSRAFLALKMAIDRGKKDACAVNGLSCRRVPVILPFIVLLLFQIPFQPWI